MTPDAHMVETLRLRTAALHRVSRSNDLLRRENDDLRARLARVEALVCDWDATAGEGSTTWTTFGPQVVSVPFAVTQIRKVLGGKP